ncbi:putative ribonuclease H protein [Citrus sinensis]|uniref:Ribonuclease H protein n=1 Tax=Citrus sinensis TaxID=2711 RepID=A0ACB8MLX5_CITSI|nr:putative ribonuclease H protein [Citrus sinensis]
MWFRTLSPSGGRGIFWWNLAPLAEIYRGGGGCYTKSWCVRHLRQWFDEHKIFYLKFKGPRFTWARGLLFKRLDRALCNSDWLTKFADNSVLHLPKVASDHRKRGILKLIIVMRRPILSRRSKNGTGRSEAASPQRYQVPNFFPVLNAYDLESTVDPVLEEEIKRVVFSMKPLKAPGSDGLHAIFYQSQWPVVGPSFCKFMADIFNSGKIPQDINTTLLVLIPKVEHPTSLSPHQTSFVPGRHIIDNIVVAQEVVHSMRKKIRKKGLMTIKLSRLVMECVTLARMSILWNGEATTEFALGRGIRQGDPLSPYIFVLCIERLSHGITQAVRDGNWKPIRLAKHGTPLTHLFFADDLLLFADDLLLFAEASMDQASTIDAMLENYCRSSEAKVNKSKTKIYFSKNVVSRDAQLLSNVLGYSVTKDLGCYLGMPFLHSRVNKATYQTILDKVDKRLTGWNAAHLSLAGRITLAHSVLQAMPIYAMQTTLLPALVRGKIEKSCRRFIWDGKSENHKMSMALLMKLSWQVVSNSDKLWVKVICSKYGLDPRHLPLSLPDKQGTRIWRAIRSTWSATMMGARWAVCDGTRTRFWLDCWATKQGPLINLAIHPVPQELVKATVSEFINVHGDWNWSAFEHLFPNSVLLQIASVMPPNHLLGVDKIFCQYEPRGNFTVRSAYEALCQLDSNDTGTAWKLAWTWKGPQAVRIFLWQALHAKLKTKEELSRRHIPISIGCERCGAPIEDVIHVLRDCQCIRRFWLRLVPARNHLSFFQSTLRDWITANLQNKWKIASPSTWECIFGVAIWRLWFWRNHFMVDGKLADNSTIYLDITARANEIHKLNNSHISQQPRRKEIFIGWIPPPWPWCKLNTDGSCRKSEGAGAGGILRDSVDHWISGFCLNIGESSVLMAELWGLYQGLRIAWDTGIKCLLVEVDSLCVI